MSSTGLFGRIPETFLKHFYHSKAVPKAWGIDEKRDDAGGLQQQASTQAAPGTLHGSLAMLGGSSASRSSTLDGTAMQAQRNGNDPQDTSAISQPIQNGNG